MSDDNPQTEAKLTASEIWEKLAPWWDDDIGDGDEFHKELIFPYMKQLVQLNVGDVLLDVGCGNGALIRYLHQEDITFIGVDYSTAFTKAAKKKSENFNSVYYQQCDATDAHALQQLSNFNKNPVKYDAIVCSMVMHDLSTIDPLFQILPDLVKEKGQFIFAIPSPHYNSVYNSTESINGEFGVFTTGYNTVTMEMEKAKTEQPYEQCNFHRPLASYINPLLQKGFVLTEMHEPVAVTQKLIESSDFWKLASKIPQVIICSFSNQTKRSS